MFLTIHGKERKQRMCLLKKASVDAEANLENTAEAEEEDNDFPY